MGLMHGCGQGGMGYRHGQRRGTSQPGDCCTAAATCTTSYLLVVPVPAPVSRQLMQPPSQWCCGTAPPGSAPASWPTAAS